MPTVPELPLPIADFDTVARASDWNLRVNRAARLVNYLGQCGVSIPLPGAHGASLPAGLQLCCRPDADRDLLAIAMGIEDIVGRPVLPTLAQPPADGGPS
jgi:Asp-tRNA(Asn)/Glu-tRNA(Gln) amidotransferase A subunit family amidase